MTSLELAVAIYERIEDLYQDAEFSDQIGGLALKIDYTCQTRSTGDGVITPRGKEVIRERIKILSLEPTSDYPENLPIPNSVEVEDLFKLLSA